CGKMQVPEAVSLLHVLHPELADLRNSRPRIGAKPGRPSPQGILFLQGGGQNCFRLLVGIAANTFARLRFGAHGNSVSHVRAVSERIESVGGFPNQLVSASSFAPREGGGGDGCFRRSSRAGGRGGGVGRVVAQSGGRAFQSERRERRALGEAVQYHGRDFADAFRGRSA